MNKVITCIHLLFPFGGQLTFSAERLSNKRYGGQSLENKWQKREGARKKTKNVRAHIHTRARARAVHTTHEVFVRARKTTQQACSLTHIKLARVRAHLQVKFVSVLTYCMKPAVGQTKCHHLQLYFNIRFALI